MATLAELTARRDALESAMASGVLSVREGEKSVTYRSFDEMARVLTELERQIAAAQGTTRTRRVYPQAGKGW